MNLGIALKLQKKQFQELNITNHRIQMIMIHIEGKGSIHDHDPGPGPSTDLIPSSVHARSPPGASMPKANLAQVMFGTGCHSQRFARTRLNPIVHGSHHHTALLKNAKNQEGDC